MIVHRFAGSGLVAWLLTWANFISPGHAELTGWRNANPIGWMHSLPVGESPGWSDSHWLNVEISQANIWNNEASFTDERTQDVYTYKADYEQTTTVIDTGFAPTKWLGLSLEIPYANHNGGFLDDFTDQFHSIARTDRFLREFFPKFGNSFRVQTNGVDRLSSTHAEGIGNLKAKAKFWLLPWISPTPGACDCGLSLSLQAKLPLESHARGLSSGHTDVSALVHLGAPWRSASGIYFTYGLTQLGPNETFTGWPRLTTLQMYELSFDFGIDSHWGIVAGARMESPLFRQSDLSYNYMFMNPDWRGEERLASGWDALTEWRSSEVLGVRYRWGQGSRISVMMMEDWGLGDRDHIHTWNYVNDAPDYEFITQWHFVF